MRNSTVKRSIWPLLISCLLVSGAAWAREKRVKMKDLPAAVQKTVQEQSRGATLKGLTKEVEGGKTYYEAELLVNGHTKDVLIDPAGAIVSVEEAVTMDSLPPVVKAEIQKQAGKRKILLVESVTKGGTLTYYEAHVKGGLKQSEIKVGPDGKLVKDK